MRLYFTETSPFARKVRVVAHELGLADRNETVFLRPSPVKTDPELSRANPLSKIPALILDDGSALYDSPVICEYLEAIAREAGRPGVLPRSGAARWKVLRIAALCDGILDAAILVFYERAQRPKELHWQPWIDGHTEKTLQGLDALEQEVRSFGPDVDLAQVGVAITVAWLEFRNAVGDVRTGRPELSRFCDAFGARASMQSTLPHT